MVFSSEVTDGIVIQQSGIDIVVGLVSYVGNFANKFIIGQTFPRQEVSNGTADTQTLL